MRDKLPAWVEKGRITGGTFGSNSSFGMTGAFVIPTLTQVKLKVISSGSKGMEEVDHELGKWEHVSVSVLAQERCPTWEEMCFVKNIFWRPDEVVFQLHPAEENHINHHPFCLHLWRHNRCNPPMPPKEALI